MCASIEAYVSLGEYDLFASMLKEIISQFERCSRISCSATSIESKGNIAHPLIATLCPFFNRPRRDGRCSIQSCGKLTKSKSQHSGNFVESVSASAHLVL